MTATILKLADRQEENAMPIDINDIAREEIAKRDWAMVHIRGDRSPPIRLGPRRLEAGQVHNAVPKFFQRGREAA